MDRKQMTHKGWFGIAPVYVAEKESRGEDMFICPRFECLEWMIDVSAWVFDRCSDLMEFMGYTVEGYPLTVGSELPEDRKFWLDMNE